MLAWYDDIKSLTTKSGEERNAFVRRHTRSFSNQSAKSVSSLEEDEADEIPYQARNSTLGKEAMSGPAAGVAQDQRPQPGGRFPSDVQIRRDLPPRLSPSDGSEVDHDISTAAGEIQGRVADRKEYFIQSGDLEIAPAHRDSKNMTNGLATLHSPTSAEMEPTTPEDALNHDNGKYTYTPGRVATFETPRPVESSTPQPHTAEVVNSETQHPIASMADDLHPNVLLASSEKKVTIPAAAEEKEVVPGLARRNTDNSVSNYCVPGQYPRGSG